MTESEAVLLVADDRETLAHVSGGLGRKGYRVVVAGTSAEARARIRAGGVGLAVLDLVLSEPETRALLDEARALSAPPEFIIVTAQATLDSAIAAVEQGMAGYVTKPVDLARLEGIAARVFERRRLQRENVHLQREAAERLAETETLLRITREVNATLDFSEALRRVCRELARLSGADTASAYVLESDQLRPVAAYHVPKEHLQTLATATLPLEGQGFQAALWDERRPVHSDDVANDPRFTHGLFRAFPHQSGLLLPLLFEDKVVGAFYAVWWRERRRFAARELKLLEGIAEQVGLLVRNARLFGEADRNRQRLEALNEVSRHLAAVHDSDEVVSLIVNEACRLLGAEAAGVRILEGDELVAAARTASAEVIMARERIRVGESLSGWVVAHNDVLILEDLAADTRHDPAHKAAAIALGYASFVGAPLRALGRTIGAINVFTTTRRRFTRDEVALLSAFADQAALAIEKARLYKEAQTQRTRLAQIFESTSDGIVLVGRDGAVQATNHRAGELLGFDADRAVGVAFAELIAGDARAFAGLRAALAEPQRRSEGDLDLKQLTRIIHWVAQPTVDAAGVTIGFTLTLQDVTQERLASQMKSDFVSFVTHQLRTPLSGIKWMLELAAEAPERVDEMSSYVNDAREAAERLINLVNDLLDASRLESGRLALALEEVDLRRLTREVLDEVAPLLREKRHDLAMDDAAQPVTARADAQLLRQVVLNLTSNAVKYTPPGGRITVRVGAGPEGAEWAITDSGIGIPKEAQRKLFEKFFRADNVFAVETEGTGLGLYLVRLIVEKHGGRVWCESEEGHGSTFAFALPAGAADREGETR